MRRARRDSSLRILPMKVIDRLPTLQEFDKLCVEVPIRVGQTLLMRYDMAHGGSSRNGLRLHTIIGPAQLHGYSLGATFPLKQRGPAIQP